MGKGGERKMVRCRCGHISMYIDMKISIIKKTLNKYMEE